MAKSMTDLLAAPFVTGVTAVAAAGALLVDARGFKQLTIITDAGATATVSRVDSASAAAHIAGAPSQFTVAPTTRTVTPVDWPFFYITSAAGVSRVALA